MNSIQYKKDDALITIEADKKETSIILHIRDNGIGIKESEIERIFQLAFTGSNGRESRSSTGIGLYLCHELCKKLGLRINAVSELNQFTEISIYFPDVRNIKQCSL